MGGYSFWEDFGPCRVMAAHTLGALVLSSSQQDCFECFAGGAFGEIR